MQRGPRRAPANAATPLDTDEAAKALGISADALRRRAQRAPVAFLGGKRWCAVKTARGEGSAINFGRRWVWTVELRK